MSVPPLDLLFPFPGSPSSADSFLTLTTPPETVLASPINCHLSLDTLDALDKLDQQDKLYTPPTHINPNLTHSSAASTLYIQDIYGFDKPRVLPQPQSKPEPEQPKSEPEQPRQSSPAEVKPDTSKASTTTTSTTTSTTTPSPPKRKAKELKDKDSTDKKETKSVKRDKSKADSAMDDNHGTSQSPMPPIRPRPIAASASSTTAAPAIASSSTVLIERRKRGRKRYSCAECRRLKLRCSKSWPCTMCERRGCGAICPDGVVDRKRERVDKEAREREAQAAAEAKAAEAEPKSQAQSSSSALVKSPLRRLAHSFEKCVVDTTPGQLRMDEDGQTRYVGSLAGSVYLRDDDADRRPSLNGASDPGAPGTSSDILQAMGTPTLRRDPVADARSKLPPWKEGRRMVEQYWEHVNWIHQVIPKVTFDRYLIMAYDPSAQPQAAQLACVLLAMALGVMFDLTLPPFHPRCHELFFAAQDLLSATRSEKPSVTRIQALSMFGTFVLNDQSADGAEAFWPIIGSTMKSALTVGLHRDGEAFGLPEDEVQERRKVFWELMEYDRVQAMTFGRPCGLSNRHMDTKMPLNDGRLFFDDSGYHHAKHCVVQMLERVNDTQVQPTPVPYATVLEIDAELQEFRKSLPESLMCNIAITDLPMNAHHHLVLQRLGIRLFISEARLHLNRGAFVQALKENSTAPSRGTFGESFIALYESAQEIVQVVKALVLFSPALAERWWFFWFHAFSAAVCLAAISLEAPASGFATPAYSGLSIVCDLSAAARDGSRVRDGLTTLLQLRKRAQERLKEGVRSPGSEDDDVRRLLLAEQRAEQPRRRPSATANTGMLQQPQFDPQMSAGSTDSALPPMEEPIVSTGPIMPLWPDAASALEYGLALDALGLNVFDWDQAA